MRSLNNKGIALVTAMMMTLIILVMIMGLMSMIIMNLKGNTAMKSYRNVTEASYGGSNLVMQSIIPQLYNNYSSASALTNNYSVINMNVIASSACFKQKMTSKTSTWSASCQPGSLDATVNPDITFKLGGVSGQSFTVSSKIVDTIPGVPYPIIPQSGGGGLLLGDGVTDTGSSGVGTNLAHTVYRIEVSGQRTTNPSERTNLSVLYEY
jgi:hypothetical protein